MEDQAEEDTKLCCNLTEDTKLCCNLTEETKLCCNLTEVLTLMTKQKNTQQDSILPIFLQ